MATRDCERAVGELAREDGIELQPVRLPWLNQRGHLGLPDELSAARELLERIFTALGGDVSAQATKRLTPLPGDFVHSPTATLVEIDESQHFTSARLKSLELYPSDLPLGYDLDEYKALCRDWAPRSDRYFASKSAVAFGAGGRQRQRAYHDALRDIAAPAKGWSPVIRVPAPEREPSEAYARARTRVRALL